jgi:hypothetical protein
MNYLIYRKDGHCEQQILDQITTPPKGTPPPQGGEEFKDNS